MRCCCSIAGRKGATTAFERQKLDGHLTARERARGGGAHKRPHAHLEQRAGAKECNEEKHKPQEQHRQPVQGGRAHVSVWQLPAERRSVHSVIVQTTGRRITYRARMDCCQSAVWRE